MRQVLLLMLLAACGDDASSGDAGVTPDASTPDTSTSDAGRRDLGLDCDPSRSALALEAASAGMPGLNSLGDADPASPDEVGDGRYHLFVGVAHEDVTVSSSCGDQAFLVLLHDATSDRVDGGYTLSPDPIVSDTIVYDQYGMETPSYIRADEHTEYIYYCAVYQSYACRDTTGVKGKLIALRRVDGGAWERVMHDVAPFTATQTSQCEPEIAFDPDTGLYHLFFIADDGPDAGGLYVRTSADPELFPAPDNDALIIPLAARPTAAFDPYDDVWRFTFDAYGADEIVTSWSETLDPGSPEQIQARSSRVHHALHDLHPTLHANATDAVLQGVSAVFPNPDEVLFFYSGIDGAGTYRVLTQPCTRR